MRFPNYSYRADVIESFESKIYPETLAGYSGDFTFINVNDGVYDMFLYCWENDDNYGLAYTGLQFIKQGNDMSCSKWQSSLLDINFDNFELEKNRCSLGSVTVNKENIEISGWVLVLDLNSDNQNVYIELQSEKGEIIYYSSKSMRRADVAKVFNNDLYINSGYKAVIPFENISDGTYTIRILLENESKVWASIQYKVVKTEEAVELIK